jgi:transposase
MARMRGDDRQPDAMFSYVSAEQRVPADHPLRAIRTLVDEVLRDMSREFDGLYARVGRPSIPPERLLRAQLLQVFYTIRSERLLMEQLDYNLLFRWFVGMDMDEPIWAPAVFSKNRDRLLNQEIARSLLRRVVERAQGVMSDEHSRSTAGTPGCCGSYALGSVAPAPPRRRSPARRCGGPSSDRE